LLFVALACAACFTPAQNDTWWHLRQGEVIWNGGALLRDHFSYTVNGGYWQNREWLSQVVFYLLFRAGGLPLLTGVLAAFITGAWYLSWTLMTGPTTERLVLLAPALITSSLGWSLRPQVFTFFFVSATAVAVSRRRWWPLPLMFLVWANLHGGVVIGYGLLATGVWCLLWQREFRDASKLATVGLLAILATLLTPLGYRLWTDTLDAANRMRQAGVFEFQPPTLGALELLPFWLLTVSLVALTVADRPWVRRDSPARGFVVVGALALIPVGLLAYRNTPLTLLLAVPAVDALLQRRLQSHTNPGVRQERYLLNAAILTVMFITATGAVAYAWTSPAKRQGWKPLAPAAITALASCPRNLYNRFGEGGFIIWFVPSQKVFIDSRFDPYPTALIVEHLAVERSGNYAPLFARFDIHCAYVPRESILAKRLRQDGWSIAFDGDGWEVLRTESRSNARAAN
jgi:hypothetical protein